MVGGHGVAGGLDTIPGAASHLQLPGVVLEADEEGLAAADGPVALLAREARAHVDLLDAAGRVPDGGDGRRRAVGSDEDELRRVSPDPALARGLRVLQAEHAVGGKHETAPIGTWPLEGLPVWITPDDDGDARKTGRESELVILEGDGP